MDLRARPLVCVALSWLAGCAGSSVIGDRGDAGDDIALDLPAGHDGDPPADAPRPCITSADCRGRDPGRPVCDITTARCVACTAADDTCPAAMHCDAITRACVTGCRGDDGCTMGAARRCNTEMHLCVECTRDDQCAPGELCSAGRCVMGCSASHACPSGRSCCDGACVDPLTSPDHCGACGRRCDLPNAMAACAAGACAVGSCQGPFRDCDMTASNGCEADIGRSADHCGACGTACAPRPNTSATCDDGTCRYACAEGFGDCDGDPSNGCETDTRITADHCGMCGNACRYANALGVCVAGACALGGCESGFANCDGMADNGCETDTNTSAAHCGGCGMACAPANATGRCAMGVCAVAACSAGFADCDRSAASGCEVDTGSSAMHCGGCGVACAPAHAAGMCEAGACRVGACTAGFANCNGTTSDGCEVNLSTSALAPAGAATSFAFAGGGSDQTVQEDISVAVGPMGNVYVLSYNDKIIVFDRDGRYLRNMPRRVWSTAYDFAVDRATGQMWTVDPTSNQVVHLTPEGNPAETWSAGSGSRGIEFARGEVFISDAGGNRVLVYSPTGTMARAITTSPALSQPRGLAVGASGNLYVTSYGDNTLRVLTPTGSQVRSIATVASPTDVAVDECRGVAYVLCESSDQWGAYRIADGSRLYTASTFSGLSHAGVTLDDDGSRLYVASSHGGGRAIRMYLR